MLSRVCDRYIRQQLRDAPGTETLLRVESSEAERSSRSADNDGDRGALRCRGGRADTVARGPTAANRSPARPRPLDRSRGRLRGRIRGRFPRRGGPAADDEDRSRRGRAGDHQEEHRARSWLEEDTRPIQGEREPSGVRESAQRVPEESTAAGRAELEKYQEAACVSRYSASWKWIERSAREDGQRRAVPSPVVLPRGNFSGGRERVGGSRDASAAAPQSLQRTLRPRGRSALPKDVPFEEADRSEEDRGKRLQRLQMDRVGLNGGRLLVARGRPGEPRPRAGILTRRPANAASLLRASAERVRGANVERQIETLHSRGADVAAQRAQDQVQGREQKVLQARVDRNVQGSQGLRVHCLPENVRRRVLQGSLSAQIQSGPPSRPATEPAVEGRQEEGAQALLRAEQARPADDRLLRRERLYAAESLLLEEHSSARVCLFLNCPRIASVGNSVNERIDWRACDSRERPICAAIRGAQQRNGNGGIREIKRRERSIVIEDSPKNRPNSVRWCHLSVVPRVHAAIVLAELSSFRAPLRPLYDACTLRKISFPSGERSFHSIREHAAS